MERILSLADEFASWDLLKDDDRNAFECTGQAEAHSNLFRIQRDQDVAGNMMNMARLERFLDGMCHLEKTLGLLLPESGDSQRAMSFIWGPLSFFVQATKDTERAFDNILDTYELLGSHLLPLYEYSQLLCNFPDSQECLAHIYHEIVKFHRFAYKLFSLRKPIWRDMVKSTWREAGRLFKHLAACLERHSQFISTQGASLRDFRLTLEEDSILPDMTFGLNEDWTYTQREFSAYRGNLSSLRRQFEEDEQLHIEGERKKLLAWISASDKTKPFHEELQKKRICENTGRWLFRKYAQVERWIDDSTPQNPALWLQAKKGFGKTVLSSIIADELLAETSKYPNKYGIPQGSKVYYFYCQGDDLQHKQYLYILKGLLHQMVEATEDLLPFCNDKMVNTGGSYLTDIKAAERLVEMFFEFNPRQYVIIDALDECATTDIELLSKFLSHQVNDFENRLQTCGQLRVMYLSQQFYELEDKHLLPEGRACIPLQTNDNKEDIRAYTKKRLSEFSRPRGSRGGFNLSDADRQQIESMICNRSEDMFLYASLAIDYLRDQPTKRHLLDRSQGAVLPKTLSKIYAALLNNIKEQMLQRAEGEEHWAMARRLLGWLMCAKRPLRLHEMQAILSYDPDLQDINFDDRMLRDHVTVYLGSLIQILDKGHISLIHSTARTYLASRELLYEPSIQCELATLCLRYLSLPYFSTLQMNNRVAKARLGWFSFQDYACAQWQNHIESAIDHCKSLSLRDPREADYERRLGDAIRSFVSLYFTDVEVSAIQFYRLPDDLAVKLAPYQSKPYYESICFLVRHICDHRQSSYDATNMVSIERLNEALKLNRKQIEALDLTDKVCLEDTVEDYYGPHLFKCPRTQCKFFYVGYSDVRDRDAHDKRHDRPFRCPQLCEMDLAGFTSRQDMERHVRNYHPDLSDGLSDFVAMRRELHDESRARFACNICQRRFTRRANLTAHLANHSGKRPYPCSRCGRAFTRVWDCRRHERTHLRRG